MSDLTENKIEVGKFYNVPCAVIKNHYNEIICYVPVIGNPHNEKQFGFDHIHYHIDGRFTTESENNYGVDENGKTNGIVVWGKNESVNRFAEDIVIKRRKCRRLTTGIKPPPNATPYWNWHKSMIGKSCKGKKCPHLGVDMFEKDSQLVCPLHNLKGCIKTEVII
jgi:hypothetical protein